MKYEYVYEVINSVTVLVPLGSNYALQPQRGMRGACVQPNQDDGRSLVLHLSRDGMNFPRIGVASISTRVSKHPMK